jgi:hypothetical protein
VSTQHHVRDEPHEKLPHRLAAGLCAQVVALIVTGILITSRIAGHGTEYPLFLERCGDGTDRRGSAVPTI